MAPSSAERSGIRSETPDLPCARASRKCSVEMYSSESPVASFSACCRTQTNSLEGLMSGTVLPLSCGSFSIAAPTAPRSVSGSSPRRCSTGTTTPSSCSSSASSRCGGSTSGLAGSEARAWAPATASWDLIVNLSCCTALMVASCSVKVKKSMSCALRYGTPGQACGRGLDLAAAGYDHRIRAREEKLRGSGGSAVMAESNVETFERLIAAFNEGGVDAVLDYYAEDIEIYDPDQAGDGTWRGHDGARQMLERMLTGAEQTVIRDFELIPAGDRVVALIHTYFRGDGGAPEVEVRDAHVLTFRDGKVVYWRLYVDPNEALTDVGLDPLDEPTPSRRSG